MPKGIDLTGQRFGRLIVLSRAEDGHNRDGSPIRRWLCKCDCGNTKIITRRELRKGDTKSCGCLERESKVKCNTTHGDSKTTLHRRWVAMRKRCRNPHDKSYPHYGGRGIKVCDEWQDYSTFKSWALSHGYSPELSLDRIDVDGDYCPDNCRYVDMTTQARNRTNGIEVMYQGKTYTLPELAELTGIPYSTLYKKVRIDGLSVGDIIHE